MAAFFRTTIGSNNSFTLIENNFRFFKMAKFEYVEFKVEYTIARCDPLSLRRMIGKPGKLFIHMFSSVQEVNQANSYADLLI